MAGGESSAKDQHATIQKAKTGKGIVQYSIDDKQEGYINFITSLRNEFMEYNGVDVNILDDCKSGAPRVLARQPSSENRAQWIQIELTANHKGGETSTTTLAVRKDNLYVKGFMNDHLTKEEEASGKCKKKRWYELLGTNKNDPTLPKKYGATPLSWSVKYKDMMKLKSTHQVKQTLECTMLGKAFAERAVRRLSRYHPNEVENADENPTRLGLAGLIVMILEAARMNPFLDTIAGGWNGGTGLTSRLSSIMWDWGSMSTALRYWKRNHYRKWPVKCRHTLGDALASICLVNNSNSETVKGSGGQSRVEILSVVVSADADVPSINKITVVADSNGKQQDIYEKTQENKHEDRCLERIVFEPTKRISAYESFDIQFEISEETPEGRSRSWTTRTWDCLKQDAERETVELVKRSVLLDSGCKLEVTYFVMSNIIATENIVEVRLMGGKEQSAEDLLATEISNTGQEQSAEVYSCTVRGTITAHIDGFKEHPIVLFKSAPEGLTVEIPSDGFISLPLTRSDVPVPRGVKLQINTTGLCITGAEACACATHQQQPAVEREPLSYRFGISKPQITDIICCSRKVQVSIAWDAEDEEQTTKATKSSPDVECMIEDDVEKFITSIEVLREKLGADEHPGEKIRLTRKPGQEPKWIRIKMKAGDHQTTLAIAAASCFGVGFLNQSGVWYESGGGLLPPEYNSVPLGWGVNYTKMLRAGGVPDSQDMTEVNKLLDPAMLGTKSFAEKAVRTLSCYPDVEEAEKKAPDVEEAEKAPDVEEAEKAPDVEEAEKAPDVEEAEKAEKAPDVEEAEKAEKDVGEKDDQLMMNQRVALAGLIIMVCESARYGSVLNHFKVNWHKDKGGFSREKKKEYSYDWYSISKDLLLRKKNNETWPENDADVRLVYSGAK